MDCFNEPAASLDRRETATYVEPIARGTIEAEWPLERALRIGGEATEGRTLNELYGKMASQPLAVDLNHLWEQLGIRDHSPGSVLDPKRHGRVFARLFALPKGKGEKA